ncbi:Spx/MgsR family RNA polymerase-binding regulatory protein [Synechococcus sp. PCC 7336]|uniref:Spx/MgsR family RNA polymerase-binding regulatory protein n=1 Tax=Synechococcus sp. PCC 7336 TaxID=195250 RepID=UPI00047815A8|nr:Spx/MgsR family RNA polymerase-binding regulatory protein [Synechococcus sp. PCC 7336]
MALQVYGIPNCGTCKKALKWLDEQSVTYEFVNTKEHPPTREAIAAWVATLTAKPIRNTSGQAYRAIPTEERNAMTDEQWIDAFADNAMLLKRPLFVKEGTAVLAGFRGSEASMRATLGG